MQSFVSVLLLAVSFALMGPPPAAGPPSQVQSIVVPVPTGLTSTLDQKQCNDHGGFAGGLACKAGLPNGMLALVWNYCDACKADGFHLYRVDGGRRDAVSIPANGTSVTIALLDVPSDGFNGKCYAVTAYRGSSESAPSGQFCVGGSGNTIQTVSLKPQHELTSEKQAVAQSILACQNGKTSGNATTKILAVGYYHYVNPKKACDWNDKVDRLGLYFDMSTLMHKKISSAHIHLRVGWTEYYDTSKGKTYNFSNYVTDHSTSCAARIGTGHEYWWEYSDWIAGDVVLTPGRYTGPDVAYDVTQIVTGWASGSSNFGFVLLCEDEPQGAMLGSNGTAVAWLSPMCITSYESDVSLEVQYSG
jgi:hypothetical protein